MSEQNTKYCTTGTHWEADPIYSRGGLIAILEIGRRGGGGGGGSGVVLMELVVHWYFLESYQAGIEVRHRHKFSTKE